MKTVVKIDPEKEYNIAKAIIGTLNSSDPENLTKLDGTIDNLKTVINVLMERATPKPRKKTPKRNKRDKKDKVLDKDFKKLPSEKFPDMQVDEKIIKANSTPICACCNEEMTESGLFKTSEKLEVIPKLYYIQRNKRVIYNCNNCNGSMTNAPSVPSISRSSNYGDSLVIDASLSKYCDLIPMERYSAMAAREGVDGLPPNSLINLTHQLATFLTPLYESIKQEVLKAQIILADETPHKMLEGDSTSNWYLWGFSSMTSCFFEAHGTRSGDIAVDFLKESCAKYLVSDGYGGYKKAITVLGESGLIITEVYCNAHAYRYFKDASATWTEETEVFLKLYGDIYALERDAENKEQLEVARQKMAPMFEEIKDKCEKAKNTEMRHSAFEKAVNYFLKHFKGLTECLKNILIPLDNNFSERLLRSHVIGRKTWYGSHSKRGARTSAILFSIVETCKINNINPRNYFTWITERIHLNEEILTPSQYKCYVNSG